ncbi:MAG: DUF4293 domain-containing protein [Cyclobacteriaceae bacterium]|nr:DUF4293 domain-containing protein [Cyclobacteriaceae bacterium HetDA_MAG_MS6]
MIQRIQTIFLFLAAACLVAMLFFPTWEKVSSEKSEVVTINAFQLTYESFEPMTGERTLISAKDAYYISILVVLAAGVALFSIFMYKNRLRQIQLGALNSLIVAGTMVALFLLTQKGQAMLEPTQKGNFLPGFYLPLCALFFNSLANRFIRRDEKLVRSADRIR